MSHVTRKPVFEVCDQLKPKPACSATEASYSLQIQKYYTIQAANNKSADQTAQMRRLICTLVVGICINRLSQDMAHLIKTYTERKISSEKILWK